ncbi:AbrB/MazE/SpoVT family DNA-binding domain-containing protein [Desulfomicrobium escambiense]|uniref:AbrB/MazE/SpoVT family DNA-binding domain-containing protein n=1 Tax=Desulfomicrobium escambiense TaxID=29503 RepID=UPI0004921B6F|nr:AbrB/MazE/SpoVT family DNA-binding domain-containing protein [Desulfomicrobium escambiense]
MLAIAKITSKGQTTIPQAVRDALGVRPGDAIVWEVNRDGVARVRKVAPLDEEYLSAVEAGLSEWNCAEDEEAYRDL